MAWDQLILEPGSGSPARLRWADFSTADEWACRARELTRPARLAELDRAPWRDQERALREAVAALSNAFRLCTLPPNCYPAFAIEHANAFDSRQAIGRAQRILENMGETGGAATFAAYRPNDLATGMGSNSSPLVSWADLGADAMPSYWPSRGDGPSDNPRRDFDGLGTGCGIQGSDVQGCDEFNWNVISWSGGVVVTRAYQVLCPARWTMEMIYRVASQFVADGAEGVTRQAAALAAAQNARVLSRFNVANISELMREVRSRTVVDPVDPVVQGLQVGLTIAAACVNAVPVYGQVASAVIGALAALVTAFSTPEQAENVMPRLLNAYLPGTEPRELRLVRAPEYSIAPPAGGGRCSPEPMPGPRVVTSMSSDGTLSVTGMEMPAGWRHAWLELITFGTEVTRQEAQFPEGTGAFAGLDASQSYLVRAVLEQRNGLETATPVALSVPVAEAIDGRALFARLYLTPAQWLGKSRGDKVAAVRDLGSVLREQYDAAITAIDRAAVEAQVETGTDLPAPPPPRPAVGSESNPLFIGSFLVPGGTTPPAGGAGGSAGGGSLPDPAAVLSRIGVDAPTWRRWSVADREAALDRAGVPAAQKVAVRDAITALVDRTLSARGMSAEAKAGIAALGVVFAAGVAYKLAK